ncbi:hypothetical protein PF010_g23177 [Phytophthora fragariae]|uniref:BED-type domain-containing protein n=1 Tax=Phytophthora fragariae TaxID=53985 RepID=A0A6G0K681_9STRA|nr:hypothetical protein PF010_g23177 [Phytophthora fragariae]
MPPTPKQLTEAIYAKLPNGCYKCRLCSKTRKLSSSGGYTNAVDHLRRDHESTFLSEYEIRAGRPRTLDSFITTTVDATSMTTYQWLDWLVMDHLPLDSCEKPRTRKYTKLDPVCAKTLKLRAGAVEAAVQARIRTHFLGKPIGLMYDAWTEGKTHYVAVIGVTPTDDDASKPDKVLLCFTPFEDETDMGADAFIELFDYVLDLYEIDVSQ